MEQPEIMPVGTNDPVIASGDSIASPLSSKACSACGTSLSNPNGDPTPSYVYAIGTIEPRFPRISTEKEFAQARKSVDTTGLTSEQAFQKVLSQRSNRYLARQLCWVLRIEGFETYILIPRDPADLELLVEALRPDPSPMDLDCVIGMRGPVSPPEMCNGLTLPIVLFDQIYSFDRNSLIKAIPRPEKIPAKEFAAAANSLFRHIMQVADNAGETDNHRTLNYLAVRYPAIYAKAFEQNAIDGSLTGVEVFPSRLTGIRKIADVVFSFTSRTTDVTEKFCVRVDVTEEFPFLVTPLFPYYDR